MKRRKQLPITIEPDEATFTPPEAIIDDDAAELEKLFEDLVEDGAEDEPELEVDAPRRVRSATAEFEGSRTVVPAGELYIRSRINQNYNDQSLAPTGLTGLGSDNSDFRDPDFEMGG